MNRYCCICDKYQPSHKNMYWLIDEGYCCASCARSEKLEVKEEDE